MFEKGQKYERMVEAVLVEKGWQILRTNFRRVGTEIDIIAYKASTLLGVEVKFRKHKVNSYNYTYPLLTYRKRLALKRGLELALLECRHPIDQIRCDMVIIYPQNFGEEGLRVLYYNNILSDII